MTLAELEREALDCTRCPLAAGRTQVVFGVGDPAARIMFIGVGPGREEDLRGEPFVGRSGQLLDRLMAEELGMDRTSCYIANVV
ncbi:MAG: uracil-DNA glycosylase, partial [Acidimicrobiales bacterium]